MIILTCVDTRHPRFLCSGDRLILSIVDATGETVVVEEEITRDCLIDYIASFRFARNDGTCVGFHLAGFFGNSKELPQEIREAIPVESLTPEQHANFVRTVGTRAA